MAIINWSQEETFKLISLWSEDNIQEQLEGCHRNSSVFRKLQMVCVKQASRVPWNNAGKNQETQNRIQKNL